MSHSAVATLEYVDEYGDVIEDSSAVELLYPSQRRLAQIVGVARAIGCALDYLLDLSWREWIDHALVAKAITWRRPSRSPHERYL